MKNCGSGEMQSFHHYLQLSALTLCEVVCQREIHMLMTRGTISTLLSVWYYLLCSQSPSFCSNGQKEVNVFIHPWIDANANSVSRGSCVRSHLHNWHGRSGVIGVPARYPVASALELVLARVHDLVSASASRSRRVSATDACSLARTSKTPQLRMANRTSPTGRRRRSLER